tara:strand:- start:3587 stop:4123 length:537 start_codon:yes stop_codon:yes gene_type:complete
MDIIAYKSIKPEISKNVFIAPGAKIIGHVEILDYSSVWYNCVLRGDVNYIKIGKKTNIQDGTIIHVSSQGFSATGDKGAPTIIGNNVTIGHNATIHACEVKSYSLIGMGAVILDRSIINEMSLVAAGALVPPGTVIGEKELWAGNPAKLIRKISSKEQDLLINTPEVYSNLSKEFLKK